MAAEVEENPKWGLSMPVKEHIRASNVLLECCREQQVARGQSERLTQAGACLRDHDAGHIGGNAFIAGGIDALDNIVVDLPILNIAAIGVCQLGIAHGAQ